MRQRITDELKEAMKAGDKVKLGVLRMVQAALKDKDIEARGNGKAPLPDTELAALLQKMIKQRVESADIYAQAGRSDLEAQERAEAAIITNFLPKQLTEQEMKDAVEEAVKEIGASTIKDMGKVVSILKEKYAGQMDFGKASSIVKEILST